MSLRIVDKADVITAAEDPESPISPIESILEDARNGKPVIIVDADDRENEGDLIVPAQFATPDVVNFFARYGRGLICLPITEARARQLRLPPMTSRNEARHETPFTVAIEAREGVTTGISTHDRARTIAVAIDPTKGADDLVSPGHIFPLVARDGGVLVRAGHTEAAVDIARLAGLQPAGMLCEILNEDGTMARLHELTAFAQFHGLKIGAISDLIAYRRRTERYVERVLEQPFESVWGGEFRMVVYRNRIDGAEHVALVKGRIERDRPTLVRMHQVDLAADVLGHAEARQDYVSCALKAIGAEGGVAVFIRDPRPQAVSERAAKAEGSRLRDYGVGAQILLDLGVRDMVLLTSSTAQPAGLDGYDLHIVGRRDLHGA